MQIDLQVQISDEARRDCTAETQHGRRDNHRSRRLECVDDGTHRQRQDELGQENHATDNADVSADPANLALLVFLVSLGVL